MKRRIRITASLLAFCVLFGLTGKLLRYILTDDSKDYGRMTFREIYEQDNIDVLFVGSSHCSRSFIPQMLDEVLQKNTFNAGSTSQDMDASLMVIKEVSRYNDVEYVYLELYYDIAGRYDTYKERTQLTQTYVVSDYLRPSVDKYLYLLSASNSEHYANSFIVARRNWTRLFDFNYMKENISMKQTDAYKDYCYETKWYNGKGYVARSEVVENWNFFSTEGWAPINVENISSDWKEYLMSIIDFCEEKGIKLTLVSTPMPNFTLANHGNYDEYIRYIKRLIETKNIEYYDFNLCREEYFSNLSELFCDVDHLNQSGSQLFSETFAKLVTGEVSAEEMFYDSYAEKLENLDPTVFGVSYKNAKSDDGQKIRNCKIVTNDDGSFEYQIAVEPIEGDPYILREFSGETTFTMNRSEGICVITYRNVDDIESEYEIRLTMPK